MVGDTGETDFANVCLLSDRGWSMFMTTLCEVDPSYMGMIYVSNRCELFILLMT